MSTLNLSNMLTPRQVASFMNELVTNSNLRAEFEKKSKEILAKFGANIQESDIPDIVKLPEMEKLQQAIGQYLENEKFGFPAQHTITADSPLVFALVVVFVFVPSHMSNQQLKAA